MILPKGTIDFSRNGGENAMEEMLDQIRKEKINGYILVIGALEDMEGASEEVTAQLLFENGDPKLCEAVVNKTAKKGIKGIHPLLRSTIFAENKIELHSKIDVGPPLAFFKECKIEEGDIDISVFKEELKKEAEEKKKIEEEKRKMKEMEENVKKEVSSWLDSGFNIEEFPAIMEREHKEIMEWHEKLSSNISEIQKIRNWVEEITEIEVKEMIDRIMESSTNPSNIKEIIKIKGDIEARMADIQEKRGEMEKWVNLWKDEGYNTEKIEETLNLDLETAWNSLTNFMDDIQRLKDHREELENLKNDDPGDFFGAEIREIDFLLNDPLEIENIIKLIWDLKEVMGNEKEGKEDLLKEAKDWEEKGYDISRLVEKMEERLDSFTTEHHTFINNISRIEQIRDEIRVMDRRDISDRIESLNGSMNDPFSLMAYETTLRDIKIDLEAINNNRERIKGEIASFREEGYITDAIDREMDGPVDKLTALLEDFKSKVGELKDIELNISDMDHRWLEDRFTEIEGKIKDVSNIDEIKDMVRTLAEIIEGRERERIKIKNQMETWENEGFKIEALKSVIEEDLEQFKTVFEETLKKVNWAKEMINTLSGLNVKYFPQEAEKISDLLHDLSIIENAKLELHSLKETVSADWKIRSDLQMRLKNLTESGWDVSGLENITDTSPNVISDRVNELNSQVDELQEAIDDIEKWDRLESSLLSGGVDECKAHLRKIQDIYSALEHYNELKGKINSNKELRDMIKEKVDEWKESGYVLHTISDLLGSEVGKLNEVFEDLVSKIGRLESLQDEFDGLKIDHFKSEAEEIEFKMNDPDVVDDIENDLEELKKKIKLDEEKREEFMENIKEYMNEGFMGAEKLNNIMNEDITIVTLEFKNFEKEVTLFRKYMESTGFQFPTGVTDSKKVEKPEPKVEEEVIEEKETVEEEVQTEPIDDEKVAPSEEKLEEEIKDDLPKMDFSNFIVDTPNEIAHRAAMEVSQKPGESYNPLLILGEKGTGKTHLISSITGKVKEEVPNIKIVSMTGKEFVDKMKEHRSSETMEDFREIFRSTDILIMDDIDQMKGDDDGQEMFINVMNGLLDSEKQVILASERDIKSLPLVAEQIRNRLDKGVSVDLESPTIEMNMKLISEFGGGENIPEDVSNYIGNNMMGSISDIRLVVQLYLQEVENGDENGLEKVKEIVDKVSGDVGHRKLTEALADTLENLNNDVSNGVIVCTNCNKEIPADSKECPHCNAIFDDIDMKECPECNELVEMDKYDCQKCGYKF